MKKQHTLLGLFLIIALGALFLYTRSSNNPQPAENLSTEDQPVNMSDTIAGTVWFGILKKSDKPSLGNLMLVAEGASTKYIQTGRDFSALIDKEVAMEIKGSEESFQLINIHPK